MPLKDPLLKEFIEIAKEYYFLNDNVSEISSYLPSNVNRTEKFLFSLIKLFGRKDSVFSSKLKRSPEKQEPVFEIDGERFNEFDSFNISKGEIFEENQGKLAKMKNNYIFQKNKRCK